MIPRTKHSLYLDLPKVKNCFASNKYVNVVLIFSRDPVFSLNQKTLLVSDPLE